jgi:hypothetical protein
MYMPADVRWQAAPSRQQRHVSSVESTPRGGAAGPARRKHAQTPADVRRQATPALQRRRVRSIESPPAAGVAAGPAPRKQLQRASAPTRPIDLRVGAASAATDANAPPPEVDGRLRPADGAERPPANAPIGEHRPISPRHGRPPMPVQRRHEHTADVGSLDVETASPTVGEPSIAVHRPGLDLRAALAASPPSGGSLAYAPAPQLAQPASGPRVRAARTAAVLDAVPGAVAARRPGLDVAPALSGRGSEPIGPVARLRAEPAPRPPAPDGPHLLTPLRVAATPEHAAVPRAADPPAPAAPAALSSPAAAPPAIPRVTSWDDSHGADRARLAEAPDDELQELADRLYGHIRARFRAELLIDRERAGLLADRY